MLIYCHTSCSSVHNLSVHMIKDASPLVNCVVTYAVVNATLSIHEALLQFVNTEQQTLRWMMSHIV